MGLVWMRYRAFSILGALPIAFSLLTLPVRSASSLAAWSLDSDGVLQLRTLIDTPLKAFFQSEENEKGVRVWIDFPGELTRPRKLKGSGPVREIRLGKPQKGSTRLVIEFHPSIELEPAKLKLVAISPERWRLKFVGLPTRGLIKIHEGNLTKSSLSNRKKSKFEDSRSLSSSLLPDVRRGMYKVVIDPGHGGPDSGAVGIGGIKETDVVLDISLQVTELLRNKGVKVHLTRSTETDLDLPPRVAMANRLRANAFISIHANASTNTRKDVNGIETFYFSGSRGFNLASDIQEQLLNVSPTSPNRGVRRGRFFVIRRTNMPAALVETGFLTGRIDSSKLASASHRRKLSFAIAKGILNYLKRDN